MLKIKKLRQRLFEINTELTKDLFDKFLVSTCEFFIYMSSIKAVADTVVGVLLEDIKPNPIIAYGKSKLVAEEYILKQKRYNLADDQSLSTTYLMSIIGKVIDKPSKILNLPKTLVKFIALLGNVLSLLVNSECLQKLIENYVVLNHKIKKVIGKELSLTTKEGIKKTIISFI